MLKVSVIGIFVEFEIKIVLTSDFKFNYICFLKKLIAFMKNTVADHLRRASVPATGGRASGPSDRNMLAQRLWPDCSGRDMDVEHVGL